MRICSLLPGATEIAYALGLGDQIVGVTHECDYPAEAKTKPIVVRSLIDSDRLSSLEIDQRVGELLRNNKSLYAIDDHVFRQSAPDVILTQGLCDVCALDYNDVLRAAKTLPNDPRIVSLTPHSLTDVLHDVLRVGEATQRRQEGEAIVRNLERRIEDARRQATQSPSRPRVACIEWFDPIYAAGHWVPEMVELAGGRDVFGRKGEPSAPVKWNQILELAPEIIVLMPCGFDLPRSSAEMPLLRRLQGWNDLPAVKAGQIYAVNASAYFSRPGPRLLDGLEILAQIIHPQIFPWRAPADTARRLG